MKIIVDPTQCALTGYCVRTAPSLFALPDDADVAEVIPDTVDGDDDRELAREAEAFCPTRAITLVE